MKITIKSLAALLALSVSLAAQENPATDVYSNEIAPQWGQITWEDSSGKPKKFENGNSATLGKASDMAPASYKIKFSSQVNIDGLYMDEYAHWHFTADNNGAINLADASLVPTGSLTLELPIICRTLKLEPHNELNLIKNGQLLVANLSANNATINIESKDNRCYDIKLSEGASLNIGREGALAISEVYLLNATINAGNLSIYSPGDHQDKLALTLSAIKGGTSEKLTSTEAAGIRFQAATLRIAEGKARIKNSHFIGCNTTLAWTSSQLELEDCTFYTPASSFQMIEGSKLTITNPGMELEVYDIQEQTITMADGTKQSMPVLQVEQFGWNAENTQVKGILSLMIKWGEQSEEQLKSLQEAHQAGKIVGISFPDIQFKNSQLSLASLNIANSKNMYTKFLGFGQDADGKLVVYGKMSKD